MRKRHTYAATRNILLDYRIRASTAKRIFRDDDLSRPRAIPEIRAHIQGAGPLKTVVIVRDNQYIYSIDPKGSTFDLRLSRAAVPEAGDQHYYYVRMEQRDRNMAWSSPIWVNYSPK